MSNYEKMANAFCKNHGVTVNIIFDACKPYFDSDKEPRNVYNVTISRKNKVPFTFTFGDSIANTQKNVWVNMANGNKKILKIQAKPTNYDILACIEKYETPSDVWEFAEEFGYTIENKKDFNKVEKICKACQKQYIQCLQTFGDCMGELREIG